MNITRLLKFGVCLVAGAILAAIALFANSAGRGNCPHCGHTSDLYVCRHNGCGWTACIPCWQRLSKYDICPGCKRGGA